VFRHTAPAIGLRLNGRYICSFLPGVLVLPLPLSIKANNTSPVTLTTPIDGCRQRSSNRSRATGRRSPNRALRRKERAALVDFDPGAKRKAISQQLERPQLWIPSSGPGVALLDRPAKRLTRD
jgi:hypothetical protein